MTKIKTLLKNQYIVITLLSLAPVILTLIGSLFGFPKVYRIFAIFIVINFVLAFVIGNLVRHTQLPKWSLLIFPIIFSLMIVFKYNWYNYFFSLLYICISLFGFYRKDLYK